jgi:hypothetical protein
VLLGGGVLMLIAPMIRTLEMTGGIIPLQLATSIFLASFVYTALMVLAMWAASHITGGWRLWSSRRRRFPPCLCQPDPPRLPRATCRHRDCCASMTG